MHKRVRELFRSHFKHWIFENVNIESPASCWIWCPLSSRLNLKMSSVSCLCSLGCFLLTQLHPCARTNKPDSVNAALARWQFRQLAWTSHTGPGASWLPGLCTALSSLPVTVHHSLSIPNWYLFMCIFAPSMDSALACICQYIFVVCDMLVVSICAGSGKCPKDRAREPIQQSHQRQHTAYSDYTINTMKQSQVTIYIHTHNHSARPLNNHPAYGSQWCEPLLFQPL